MAEIALNTLIFAIIAIILLALIAWFFLAKGGDVFQSATDLSKDTEKNLELCYSSCDSANNLITQDCEQWKGFFCSQKVNETHACWQAIKCKPKVTDCTCEGYTSTE